MIIVVTFEGNEVQIWTDDGLIERHTIQEKHLNDLFYSIVGAISEEVAAMKLAEKRGELR